MPYRENVSIDVGDVVLIDAAGARTMLRGVAGVQVVVLMRHRHELPCQQHLVQVQDAHDDPRIGLLLVGFSPADRLAPIARRLGWTGAVLSDPDRELYRRLGIGGAPWWRVYTPATLAIYARARRAGRRPSRPTGEDTPARRGRVSGRGNGADTLAPPQPGRPAGRRRRA